MAAVHHFAYGPINPIIAYVMSFMGSLLGLVLTARARESEPGRRARWLALAAVAIGGTAIWLMHFMAMLGFDVPGTTIRYDVPITFGSLAAAVVIVGIGLLIVGLGNPSVAKVLLGGAFTGLGVAAMHYSGMAAMHLGGRVRYDVRTVALSVAIAIVAATVALWFALIVHGAAATVGAALIMAFAVCTMHYTAMAAMRVQLDADVTRIPGVNPFVLLMPISVLACIVISGLAYSALGFSMHRENEREEAMLAEARNLHHSAAMVAPGLVAARHR